MPGIDDVPFLTNSSMMHVDYLPEHLVVVGGSYIGLEFAQIYRRFGSEVTIVEMGPRLSVARTKTFPKPCAKFWKRRRTDPRECECISLAKRSDGIAVGVECSEAPPEVLATHVLVAVGRTPNTNDLGLERAGVDTDERGYIVVNDQLQTNVAGIWALGDCNGRGAFTHTAYNDYEIVADNLLNADRRRVSDRIQTYALYIDPPLGAAHDRCRATQIRTRRARGEISHEPRGAGDREGRNARLHQNFGRRGNEAHSGAAILGTGGDEVVHVLLDAMYAKVPYTVIQRAMHIHPTVAEFLPTVLSKLEPFK
jgi:pyruvate/2-oxoglutarate dehydrogenase complex dihydrolipoamide dehydrogenase (E3) component